MALTRTTLSSAYTVGDNQIVVASATGFAVGKLVRIDQEWFLVRKDYDGSSTTVPVIGGQYGSKGSNHVATAGVIVGTAKDDFASSLGVASKAPNPVGGRSRLIESFSAATTVTHYPGVDHYIELNGTSVVALTVPVPTTDMTGDILVVYSNGAAAHTITFTGGLSGAGSSYDVITVNATAPAAFMFVANSNATWQAFCGPAMGGTVTNIIGSVA